MNKKPFRLHFGKAIALLFLKVFLFIPPSTDVNQSAFDESSCSVAFRFCIHRRIYSMFTENKIWQEVIVTNISIALLGPFGVLFCNNTRLRTIKGFPVSIQFVCFFVYVPSNIINNRNVMDLWSPVGIRETFCGSTNKNASTIT